MRPQDWSTEVLSHFSEQAGADAFAYFGPERSLGVSNTFQSLKVNPTGKIDAFWEIWRHVYCFLTMVLHLLKNVSLPFRDG